MEFQILHTNLTVFDLDKSIEFYKKALGLEVTRTIEEVGAFKIVYLGKGENCHQIELTWLADRKTPYNLGDNEIHIAFRSSNYEESHELHKTMGVICYENQSMGLYFINDPDGYWIEIMPVK